MKEQFERIIKERLLHYGENLTFESTFGIFLTNKTKEEKIEIIKRKEEFFEFFKEIKIKSEVKKVKKVKKESFKISPSIEKYVSNYEKPIFRFAPSPTGPLHIGHSRVVILNYYLKKKFNGKFILRYEDTNFKTIYNKAYKMILEDLEYLGVIPDKIYKQSKRLKIYLKYGEKLAIKNLIYLCVCENSYKKELIKSNKSCICQIKLLTKEDFNEYINSDQKGAIYLIYPKNDFIIFRKINNIVSPMMNFAVTIDDYLMKVTDIIRGKDHELNLEKQIYLQKVLNFSNKINIKITTVGFVSIGENPVSTSFYKELIEKDKNKNWSDSSFWTICAMKKKGIIKEKLFDYWLKEGLSNRNIKINEKKLLN